MSESHLRQLLHDASTLAPETLEREAKPRRRRVIAPVLVAAAVAATALLVSTNHHARPGPVAPTSGNRQVLWRGLVVSVPEAWATDATRCGQPSADTVFFDFDDTTDCGRANLPVPFDSVELGTVSPNTPCEPKGRTYLRSCSGSLPYESVDPQPVTVVSDGTAVVIIAVKDPLLQKQIAESVHVVDSYDDCPVHDEQLSATSPTRDGAADSLVPGTPVSATVCRYDNSGLIRTAVVTDVKGWVSELNGLEKGLGRVPASAPDAQQACDSHDAFRVRFTYADGPPLDLWLRVAGCGYVIGYGNGARTGFATTASVRPVVTRVGSDGGFSNPDHNEHQP